MGDVSLRIMQDSTFKKRRPVWAYFVGGVLLALGILGLLVEFSRAAPSSTNFRGYVLAVEFLTCGLLIVGAVRSYYGGGLWSFLGVALVAVAVFRSAIALEVDLRGGHFRSPVIFYSTLAASWGIGFYCLAWGHIRHHRKEQVNIGHEAG